MYVDEIAFGTGSDRGDGRDASFNEWTWIVGTTYAIEVYSYDDNGNTYGDDDGKSATFTIVFLDYRPTA